MRNTKHFIFSFSFFILLMSPLTPSPVLAQQFLPMKGIVNARDLGGYEVHD